MKEYWKLFAIGLFCISSLCLSYLETLVLGENYVYSNWHLSQSQVCEDLGVSENNIFVIETVARSPRAPSLGAIESAARNNPMFCVTLIYSSRTESVNYTMEEEVSMQAALDKLVYMYGNIRTLDMPLEEAVKDTPMSKIVEMDLFKYELAKKPRVFATQTSDVMRYAILYKYGGIFIDHDMIVIRSMNTTEKNCIMVNGNGVGSHYILSSFIRSEKQSEFLRLTMEKSVETYDPHRYLTLMGALMRVGGKACSEFKPDPAVEELEDRYKCGILSIMKSGYGISTVKGKDYLLNVHPEAQERIRNETSILVHVGITANSVHSAKIDLITSNVTVADVFRQNCPILKSHFRHLYL